MQIFSALCVCLFICKVCILMNRSFFDEVFSFVSFMVYAFISCLFLFQGHEDILYFLPESYESSFYVYAPPQINFCEVNARGVKMHIFSYVYQLKRVSLVPWISLVTLLKIIRPTICESIGALFILLYSVCLSLSQATLP